MTKPRLIHALCRALAWALFTVPFSAAAYPGAPDTWGTWNYFEDNSVQPGKIAARTDPDGRLRTAFIDLKTPSFGDYYTYHQSFRPYLNGTILKNELSKLESQFLNTVSSQSTAASQERNRVLLSTALRRDQRLRIIVSGNRFSAADLAGPQAGLAGGFAVESEPMPMAARPLFIRRTRFLYNDTIHAFTEVPNLGSTEAKAYTNGTGTFLTFNNNDTRFEYLNRVDLASVAPSGWLTDRTFTGGDIAVSPDTRNFYLVLTSFSGPLATAQEEVRLFHIVTDGRPTPPAQAYTITSTLSLAIYSGPMGGSPPAYPQILCTSTGEPKWVTFENGDQQLQAWRRNSFGSDQQSILAGYAQQLSRGRAIGCSASLDQLDRLHLAYQEIQVSGGFSLPSLAAYVRENGGGIFDTTLLTRCTGAPAVAVGPGNYPYVVYNGRGVSGTGVNRLIVAYPNGLASAYPGDYEDHDGDGRIGLVEIAQGSDDTYPSISAPTSIASASRLLIALKRPFASISPPSRSPGRPHGP
jgi:hypothetical protein